MVTFAINRQAAQNDCEREIKRRVSMPYAMRNLVRWRKRPRNRFDCGLCHGGGIGPVSVKEQEWYCHHCHEGGDVIRLIMLAHNCSFIDALKFLAEEAHVTLPSAKKLSPEERRRLAAEQAERERVRTAAVKLKAARHELRLHYRDLVHGCERRQREVGQRLSQLRRGAAEKRQGETEGCWTELASLTALLRHYLACYWILAFASRRDRAMFTLRPALRQSMIDHVLLIGGVADECGKWMEVVL